MQQPLFRTDLVCKAIDADGQRWVDVSDPRSGSSYRFYELEFAIACALDGTRDVGAVSSWARVELGLDASPHELNAVIETLGSLGYLAGAGASAAPPPVVTAPMPAAAMAAAAAASMEVELGSPGGAASIHERPTAPRGAEFELGMPGAAPAAASAATPRASAGVELGAPGRSSLEAAPPDDAISDFSTSDDQPTNAVAPTEAPRRDEISVDLSQQFRLDELQVKEAVRQSRVMKAAELPPEDDDAPIELVAKPAAAPAAAAAAAPAATAASQADKADKAIVLPSAPAIAAAAAPPAVAVETPASAAAPARTLKPRNVVLLVAALALIVFGGTYVYLAFFKDKVGKPMPTPEHAPVVGKGKGKGKGKKPAAAPAEAATLATEVVTPVAVVSDKAGVVAWIAPTQPTGAEPPAVVPAGEPLIKLNGFEAVEKEIARSKERLKIYQDLFDKAAASGDKVAMKAAEGDVKRKQSDIERVTAKLATLVVPSPIAGVYAPKVALRAAIANGAELGTVTAPARLVATFATTPGLKVGEQRAVHAKDDKVRGETCEVIAVQGSGATLACPAVGSLLVGDAIVLSAP